MWQLHKGISLPHYSNMNKEGYYSYERPQAVNSNVQREKLAKFMRKQLTFLKNAI